VALTLCFTPAHLGVEEHHTSPPRDLNQFADFAAWAAERYTTRTVIESQPGAKEVAIS
jgi:hypothetical protein